MHHKPSELTAESAHSRRAFALGLFAIPFWMQGCAQPFEHIVLVTPPGTRIDSLSIFYDSVYSDDFLKPVPGFEAFQSKLFRELFETTSTDLLNHNGIVGRGVTRPPVDHTSSVLRVRASEAFSLQRGVPMKVLMSADLYLPGARHVGQWFLDMNARIPSGDDRATHRELERAIAQYVLLNLRVLQAKSLVTLKFDPPQTMAGSSNALLGRVR